MKWVVGDRVLYKYRPDVEIFGDNAIDYYGNIVSIEREAGTMRIAIKFDTIPELCTYALDDYVIQTLEHIGGKFDTDNPNRTFLEKSCGTSTKE